LENQVKALRNSRLFIKTKILQILKLNFLSSREASEVIDGYGTQASTGKQKKSYWSEEDEEKLTRVFKQLKEMEESKEKSDGWNYFD